MRCFLACFGLSKNRKHRKPPNRIRYADQIHGSYEPLESNVKTSLKSNGSESGSRGSKGKAISVISLKKKVSFNLDVKSYEPLPHVEYKSYFSDSEDDICKGNKEENARTGYDSILDELEREAYPSDHRYQNWRESDDDMKLEESDLDDYGSDDKDEEMSEESLGQSATQVGFDESSEGKKENVKPLVASLDQELKKLGFDSKAKIDRSECVFSVLNPIENITQWKAVKANRPMASKQQRKENTRFDFDCKANTSQIKHIIQHTSKYKPVRLVRSIEIMLLSKNNEEKKLWMTRN